MSSIQTNKLGHKIALRASAFHLRTIFESLTCRLVAESKVGQIKSKWYKLSHTWIHCLRTLESHHSHTEVEPFDLNRLVCILFWNVPWYTHIFQMM